MKVSKTSDPNSETALGENKKLKSKILDNKTEIQVMKAKITELEKHVLNLEKLIEFHVTYKPICIGSLCHNQWNCI